MMRRYGTTRLLFNKAGGEGDAGGGGGTSLLNTGGDKGGGNASGAQGAAGGEGGGDKSGGNSNAAGGDGTTTWISSLPKELQEDATIKKFTSVEALAKSYINAQRHLGSDKIPIPSQHATEDDWKMVFEKLGLPAADKYDVKFAEQATLDKEFVDQFKQNAHKLGILPKQAQGLADWFSKSNAEAEAKVLQTHQAQTDKEIKGLRDEWGKAFDEKLRFANNALAKFADKETLEYMGKTGLANNVKLTKLLSAMGEALFKEGSIADTGGTSGGITPSEAKKQYNAIVANFDHPYHNKLHPGHKAAVEEVAKLVQDSIVK